MENCSKLTSNSQKHLSIFPQQRKNKTDFDGQILQDGTASMQSRLNLKHFLRKGSQTSVSWSATLSKTNVVVLKQFIKVNNAPLLVSECP